MRAARHFEFETPIPKVNIINFLRADPKSAKKDSQNVSLFALSGSVRAKAARRTLMKFSPDLN
jgi:hypothetical protein